MSEAPPLAGVVGWPIGHSRSPQLHGHWLRRYGIRGHYVPLAVKVEDFADALRILPRLGFRGVNVTIPHKETALDLATSVSDRAALIGAANALTFRGGKVHADNTDGYGFVANLKQETADWRAGAGPALVLGAGGAARAVIHSLLVEGAPEVRLSNRTRARADGLAAHFGAKVRVVDWSRASTAVEGAMTIVNTTPMGMAGEPHLSIRLELAPARALVTDIVYAPPMTPFLREAASLGLTVVDGVGMLLHQAAPAFESWFGQRPEVDARLRSAVLAP